VIVSIETQIKNSKISILRSFDVRTMFYSRSYFESIIINLLTNAIKYRSTDRPPIIQVSTTEDENYIILKVKDNGIGIDLNTNRKKLFGLYQRFSPTIEGKGIGLFMIKSHIESLKGRIEVESELGVGTVFSIFFPKNINS
ncbi:MAG: HAMP domain-containing histidine kinase, partial [Bacteroidetes bacterium]|nr:HAMP domain-containing histidine kinase [Bacteroidota bacterium]